MGIKIAAGAVAMILVLGYLLAPVIKLKEIDLGIVIIIGITMMAIDLLQSLKSKDD